MLTLKYLLSICIHCVQCHNIQCLYFQFILYCVFSFHYLSQMDRILQYFVRLIVILSTEYNRQGKKNSGKNARTCLCFTLETIVWWQGGAYFKEEEEEKKRLTEFKMLHCHAKILFENLFSFLIFVTYLSEIFWNIVVFTFLPKA